MYIYIYVYTFFQSYYQSGFGLKDLDAIQEFGDGAQGLAGPLSHFGVEATYEVRPVRAAGAWASSTKLKLLFA